MYVCGNFNLICRTIASEDTVCKGQLWFALLITFHTTQSHKVCFLNQGFSWLDKRTGLVRRSGVYEVRPNPAWERTGTVLGSMTWERSEQARIAIDYNVNLLLNITFSRKLTKWFDIHSVHYVQSELGTTVMNLYAMQD